MSYKSLTSISLILIIMFSGCVSQPTPETETPAPTVIPNVIEEYGKGIGLSNEVIEILKPADTNGILDENEKKAMDLLKGMSEEGQLTWVKWMMMDKQITEFEIREIEKKFETAEKEKKALEERTKNLEKAKKELETLKNDTFTLEDGMQTDLEKSYLANPNDQKLAQDLKKYYLGEIEKIYPELAPELKKLPDLAPLKLDKKGLEALEDIYGLLLTAEPYKNYNDRFKSNIPKENETWEAFELMIIGGTPDPKDFQYTVPKYNTELQALLWIAEQNEFKKNDTLAQAIAMDNGLFITVGNEEVRRAVYNDLDDFLKFFRETDVWQLENGLTQLEEYPLEVKIVLVDRTGKTPANQVSRVRMDLFNVKIANKVEYDMNNVSLETLKRARTFLIKNNFLGKTTTETFSKIERNIYDTRVYKMKCIPPHCRWLYVFWTEPEGKEAGRSDVDYIFESFWKNDYFIGGCAENAQVVNAFGMSIGISVDIMQRTDMVSTDSTESLTTTKGHWFPIYYESISKSWHGYLNDVRLGEPSDISHPQALNIFRPPILQKNYFEYVWDNDHGFTNCGFFIYYEVSSFAGMLKLLSPEEGIPTTQMKQWLLYP